MRSTHTIHHSLPPPPLSLSVPPARATCLARPTSAGRGEANSRCGEGVQGGRLRRGRDPAARRTSGHDRRQPRPRQATHSETSGPCARVESRLIGGSVRAEPVRRPWRWPWPQRAQTLTTALTAWRRAACRARRAHGVLAAWRGSVVLAKSGVKTTELDSAGMKKTTKRTRGAIWVAGGGVLRLWQGAGPTRIAQGPSVGGLQPKVHSLGVAG